MNEMMTIMVMMTMTTYPYYVIAKNLVIMNMIIGLPAPAARLFLAEIASLGDWPGLGGLGGARGSRRGGGQGHLQAGHGLLQIVDADEVRVDPDEQEARDTE